jgi:Ras family protein T1
LQEFGSKYESEVLRSRKRLDMADVIIYLYDSSDANSFSYLANIRVSPNIYIELDQYQRKLNR